MNKYALSAYIEPELELICLDEVISTNTYATELIKSGALKRDTLITASRQTAGKGRIGRRFFSPTGGIYMSLVLKTAPPPEITRLLTPAAAVAVCRAAKKICRVKCGIKWVNDIELYGKKVCGILCESVAGAVIIGIGVNFLQTNPFPPELAEIATALYNEQPEVSAEAFAAGIINELYSIVNEMPVAGFIAEYRRFSTLPGQQIVVHTLLDSYIATALGVDDQCRLVIQTAAGEIKTLSSGEISVRRI